MARLTLNGSIVEGRKIEVNNATAKILSKKNHINTSSKTTLAERMLLLHSKINNQNVLIDKIDACNYPSITAIPLHRNIQLDNVVISHPNKTVLQTLQYPHLERSLPSTATTLQSIFKPENFQTKIIGNGQLTEQSVLRFDQSSNGNSITLPTYLGSLYRSDCQRFAPY